MTRPFAELLGEECKVRETRRVKSGLMTACSARITTLESFAFSFQSSLDRNRIMTLAQLGFVERREVVHFLGPPGAGKSHLAFALGVAAALPDRLLHHAVVVQIEGSSYRLGEHAALVPETLGKPTAVPTPKRRPDRPRKSEVPVAVDG